MEEKNMNELLKKAEVLIEALPYIQRFIMLLPLLRFHRLVKMPAQFPVFRIPEN